jgi:hypothetical protein
VRIAALALPPLPPERVAAAAGFALEDQLAGPRAAQHLAVSAQQTDGRVRVAIVARPLIAALTDDITRTGALARIVAEPDLALARLALVRRRLPPRRRPSGAPTAAPSGERAGRWGARRNWRHWRGAARTLPDEVRVEADVAEAISRAGTETGVAFVRGTPWRWHAVRSPRRGGDRPAAGHVAPTPMAPRGARSSVPGASAAGGGTAFTSSRRSANDG